VVQHGINGGEPQVIRLFWIFVIAWLIALPSFSSPNSTEPAPEAFHVYQQEAAQGPRITPLLQYQLEQAWHEDEERQHAWAALANEAALLRLQRELREKLLHAIGGLPSEKTDLHPQITGRVRMNGFSIEKVIFQSLPGVYVTALLYVPDDHSAKHPAVLVPAGHAANGKIHYQALSQRLVQRGYVVISWDPVGQGERSQFWDASSGKSRYNLVCAEHAVMGNLAYLAGASLARWEIWDGMRAVDYLLTRPEVDPARISITGTSGGGFQTTLIAALDERIKVVIPSCYITALPMRMANRIFADPDSDPEQDLYQMEAAGLDHPGLLLLMYPRPLFVAAAVLDFFPIEGTRKTMREVRELYERFAHGDRISMVEGYHGHDYSLPNQEAAFSFLDRFNNQPQRSGLPAVAQQDAQTLRCTRTGQVMLDFADAKSLMQVIREYFEEHRSGHTGRLAPEYYGEKYPGIKDWTVREYAGVPSHPNEISWEAVGTSTIENISVDRYVLRHSRTLEMPLLHIHKAGQEKQHVLLWFTSAGKVAAENWGAIQSLLDRGYQITSFDFRGLGETRMKYTAVSPDDPLLGRLDFDHAYVNAISGVLANYVYNSLLVGRPYFLQMLEDAEIARRFAEKKLGARVDAVTAPGDAYTVASAIAETLPDMHLLPEKDGEMVRWSEIVDQKRETWPIQYVLPGGAYIH
jgi:Acetyl xylan esterase (AXE1)